MKRKINWEDVRAIKLSIIKGLWGKKSITFNGQPWCILGHAVKIGVDPDDFSDQISKGKLIRFNDAPQTTRWDVIAKLGQIEREMREKEMKGVTHANNT